LFREALNGTKTSEWFRAQVYLLKELVKAEKVVVTPDVAAHPRFKSLLNTLNSHNTYKPSAAALQNMVAHHTFAIVTDPRNMIQSHYPIDMALDELTDAIKDIGETTLVNMHDNFSQYQM
jgi:hypothetical protein